LYKKSESEATRKVEHWLRVHGISYSLIFPEVLTELDIKQMLRSSERGFEEILVGSAQHSWKRFHALGDAGVTVGEMIREISKQPELLRSPILFDKKKLLAGFHMDEIRQFIPRSRRSIEREK
jgi:regulatory protein spx